jgi:signal transduction histidine kinase
MNANVTTSKESIRQTRLEANRRIHDEITQTLIAINLRLLAMKKSVKDNTDNLKKQIADTQRLVKQSRKPIYRLAHKILVNHEK